jgi:hypothetical protein
MEKFSVSIGDIWTGCKCDGIWCWNLTFCDFLPPWMMTDHWGWTTGAESGCDCWQVHGNLELQTGKAEWSWMLQAWEGPQELLLLQIGEQGRVNCWKQIHAWCIHWFVITRGTFGGCHTYKIQLFDCESVSSKVCHPYWYSVWFLFILIPMDVAWWSLVPIGLKLG